MNGRGDKEGRANKIRTNKPTVVQAKGRSGLDLVGSKAGNDNGWIQDLL